MSPEEPGPARDYARNNSAYGKPHPNDFSEQDSHPILGEEAPDAEVGYQ